MAEPDLTRLLDLARSLDVAAVRFDSDAEPPVSIFFNREIPDQLVIASRGLVRIWRATAAGSE